MTAMVVVGIYRFSLKVPLPGVIIVSLIYVVVPMYFILMSPKLRKSMKKELGKYLSQLEIRRALVAPENTTN